jgi:regulation of enolase protein 1 (concanavalin A-like superfamily)
MNDINSKMIYDGYKSLSDKVDDFDYKIKMLYEHIKDHRSAIIELDNKIECLIECDDDEISDDEISDDEKYIKKALEYSDTDTLLMIVRHIMKNRDWSLHDVIREIIRNA